MKMAKQAIRYKGMLGDGHVHMTASEMAEHNIRERYVKEDAVLKKLANNPAIDTEIRHVVWRSILRSNEILSWRMAYINLLHKYDELRKQHKRDVICCKDCQYGKPIRIGKCKLVIECNMEFFQDPTVHDTEWYCAGAKRKGEIK